MNIIVGTKVYSKDENILYPNCKTCGNEQSPFAFVIKDVGIDLMIKYEKANLILEKKDKEAVILMCKHCCKHIGMEV